MVESTPVIPSSVSSMSLTKNSLNKSGKSISRPKPLHPPTADMVKAAIFALEDRHGTSLQAIKKYININYQLDAVKMAPFVKRYIKTAVSEGKLIQTRGKGASGSFKLPPKIVRKASKTSIKSDESRKTPKIGNKIISDKKNAKKSYVKMESPVAIKKTRQIKPERKIKEEKNFDSKNNHNNSGLNKKRENFEVKKNIGKVVELKNVNKNKKAVVGAKNSLKK